MAAKTKTDDKIENTADMIRNKAIALGDKASEMASKAGEMANKGFEQNWQLGLQVQEKMFSMMEHNLDMFRTQVDFMLDNQKALLDLSKKQLVTAEGLVKESIEQSADQLKGAFKIN